MTIDLIADLASDGKMLRLIMGMTAVASLIMGMRHAQPGASYGDTAAELGRPIHSSG